MFPIDLEVAPRTRVNVRSHLFLFRSHVLASYVHDMNGGNNLDSIMRRVKLIDEKRTSKDRRFEFDREQAPSSRDVPSKCVVEEIHEEVLEDTVEDIVEERGGKVLERPGDDTNNATPDIKEAREPTALPSRGSLAPPAVFETEMGRGEGERVEGERVEYSDGSVYEGDVVVVEGKVVRHGQVRAH